MIDLLKMLNKIICAGLGLTEHWLGDTSESNLATAASTEIAVISKFERRQRELKGFFVRHITKLLQAKGIENPEFEVIPPELSAKDAVAFANAFKGLCEGLVLAVEQMWVSDETAAQTLGDYLDYFESFDTEIEKMENIERLTKKLAQLEKKKGKEESPQKGAVPPQLVPFATEFEQALKETETKFQRAAMDDILKDYARSFVDSFNKARNKVLAAAKERFGERASQEHPPDTSK